MVMNSDANARPVLTADERAMLLSHEAPLRVVEQTLTDLESIGADVSAERDLLTRTQVMRQGLLEKFSSGVVQSTPIRPSRKRG